jgi:hypothetical protein
MAHGFASPQTDHLSVMQVFCVVLLVDDFASSEESVGDVRLRQLAKCMIQRGFRDVEGSESVGFSHGQFGLVVETLDHTAGELLPGAEIVQDQRTVRA